MRDVGLRGRGRPRLDGITVRLDPGVVYGLIGPNGAGKSSMMGVLAGLVPHHAGEVVGRPVAACGVVLGGNGLHPGRTVQETMRLRAAYVRSTPGAAQDALRRAGLATVGRRRVGALSLGMRVRLAVSAAMLGDPELVLLDEPMNGLDPNGIAWVRESIGLLRARGATVVVSSHLLSELERVIDVAIIMSEGKVTRVETLSELTQPGCTTCVDQPGVLISLLQRLGHQADLLEGWVSTDLAAPDVVRLAVAHSLDVRAVRGRVTTLAHLYARASNGEHVAEVGR